MIEKIADDLIGQMTEARLIDKEAIPEAVYSTEIIITPLITQALQSCA